MPMIVWRAHLCRREGVNPDELLGWCNFTEDGWGCPELFLVVSGGKALEHLIEAGYDLGPSMGYCIKVPMHASGGRSGEDGTPLPVVWGNFSMLMWASAFGQPVAVKSLLHLGLLVFILRHDFRLPPWNTLRASWRLWVKHLHELYGHLIMFCTVVPQCGMSPLAPRSQLVDPYHTRKVKGPLVVGQAWTQISSRHPRIHGCQLPYLLH